MSFPINYCLNSFFLTGKTAFSCHVFHVATTKSSRLSKFGFKNFITPHVTNYTVQALNLSIIKSHNELIIYCVNNNLLCIKKCDQQTHFLQGLTTSSTSSMESALSSEFLISAVSFSPIFLLTDSARSLIDLQKLIQGRYGGLTVGMLDSGSSSPAF